MTMTMKTMATVLRVTKLTMMVTTTTMATARWATARRDTMAMATGDDDNDVNGDSATGNKVDDDGA